MRNYLILIMEMNVILVSDKNRPIMLKGTTLDIMSANNRI